MKDVILKFALQNAVKFNGKAAHGNVIGKVFAEKPELKKKAKEISKEIAKIVKEVNKMSLKQQTEKLQKLAPELLEKKQAKEKEIFAFLEIKPNENIVTAFPPEPSKYPHIGHAKALLVNYELARKYNGRFILRFEDTNPLLAKKEFYDIHLDNYKWLGVKPDKIIYVSDFIDEMYKYAEKLVKNGNAYVCKCSQDQIRENRYKMKACKCRKNDEKTNLKQWHSMFDKKTKDIILRLKIDLKHKNSTMRDPAIFRIIDYPHPKQKNKYRVWPNYDFENAVMDGINGITHRLRSKEFEMRNELQRYIQKLLGFKQTKIYEFARFNLEGVESSGRTIREKIKSGEYKDWDDPNLTTIVALRRRGFLPEAIKEFVLSTGITKAEATLTWDDLIVHNKRLLDQRSNRYFYIAWPKEIVIKGAPEKTIKLKKHPDHPERGFRTFKINEKFIIDENDYNKMKNGELYRLIDCINFKKIRNGFEFVSEDYKTYKGKGKMIIHWLPADEKNEKVTVYMPGNVPVRHREAGTIPPKGIAEKDVSKLKTNDVVQFQRFGFVRCDKKNSFWFTHG